MPIIKGQKIKDVYFEDEKIKDIYKGNNLVYSKQYPIKIELLGQQTINLSAIKTDEDLEINWGDGTINTNKTHTYTSAGKYNIDFDITKTTQVRVNEYDEAFFYGLSNLKKLYINMPELTIFTGMNARYDLGKCVSNLINCEEITFEMPKAIIIKNCLFGIKNLKKLKINAPSMKYFTKDFLASCESENVIFDINIPSLELIYIIEGNVRGFLGWTNIKSFDFNIIKNIKKLNDAFVITNPNIETIDISMLTNLQEIGHIFIARPFLQDLPKLKKLYLPLRTPPIARYSTGTPFFGSGLTLLEEIHCGDYLEEYKVADGWKEKASLMVY